MEIVQVQYYVSVLCVGVCVYVHVCKYIKPENLSLHILWCFALLLFM